MEIHYGNPFRGESLEKLRLFLLEQEIFYDEQTDFSVCLMEGSLIAAAGSLGANVLKCIAVAPAYQNEGLAACVVSELIHEAARRDLYHLFVFTRPENRELFASLGFFSVAETEKALLMENKKDGIAVFVSGLKAESSNHTGSRKGPVNTSNGITGAIVANCNPFTNGHLYLIETAASQCDMVHVFILSENKSEFPAELRRELVAGGTAHIPNVVVHSTGPYLISAATFPDYFLKGNSPEEEKGELDLTIFAERIAGPLKITRRYVGTEPYSPVTAAYNRQMKEILPRFGIEVIEIPRLEIADVESGVSLAVSASEVRSLMMEGKLKLVEALVPAVTYEYLRKYDKQS